MLFCRGACSRQAENASVAILTTRPTTQLKSNDYHLGLGDIRPPSPQSTGIRDNRRMMRGLNAYGILYRGVIR